MLMTRSPKAATTIFAALRIDIHNRLRMTDTPPTTADMQAVYDLAKARGLGCEFWDVKKRYLVITMPLDGPQKEISAPVSAPDLSRADPGGDEGNGQQRGQG